MDNVYVEQIINSVIEEHDFDITSNERSKIKFVVAILAMMNIATEESITEAVMLVGLQKRHPDIPV